MGWSLIRKDTKEVVSHHKCEATAQRAALRNRNLGPLMVQSPNGSPVLPDWIVNRVIRDQRLKEIKDQYRTGTYKLHWGKS